MFFFYGEQESQLSTDGWNLQLRQTWEPGDTDHIASGDIGTRITTGTTTTIVDHSSLSNPISFSGDKCLAINTYHYPYQLQKMWGNTPELVSTSQSTAVSIRLLVRDLISYGSWAIHFRNTTNGTYESGYYFGNNHSGYTFGIGVGNIQPAPANYTWQWYRADLIPQFNNGVWVNDKLEFYVAEATSASPEWQLIGETFQSSIPWDHSAHKYNMILWADNSQSSPNKVFWIDNLEFYTKEV